MEGGRKEGRKEGREGGREGGGEGEREREGVWVGGWVEGGGGRRSEGGGKVQCWLCVSELVNEEQ